MTRKSLPSFSPVFWFPARATGRCGVAVDLVMRALVALGSNLGDSEASLDDVDRRLQRLAEPGSYNASNPHEFPAIGGPAGQRAFLNAAAAFDTSLSPEGLLSELRSIEERHGRDRS